MVFLFLLRIAGGRRGGGGGHSSLAEFWRYGWDMNAEGAEVYQIDTNSSDCLGLLLLHKCIFSSTLFYM